MMAWFKPWQQELVQGLIEIHEAKLVELVVVWVLHWIANQAGPTHYRPPTFLLWP
jgi:hypothetical protein